MTLQRKRKNFVWIFLKNSVTIKHDVSFEIKEIIFQCFTFITICYFTAQKTIFSFSRLPEKMVFLVPSTKVVFFPPENTVFFRWTENEGVIFLKKYTKTWYFLFDMFHAPLPKKSKMILSRKNTPKRVWRSRSTF